MTNDEINNELIKRLQTYAPQGTLEIPPKILLDMEAEMLDFNEEAQTLKMRFPVKERYQNPLGYMQGGIMVAMLDGTMGPLSYLLAPPSVTTQINTTYVRPVTPDDAFVYVEARVVEKTRRQIFLEATATNEAGKLLAMCNSTSVVIGE